jgi:hypothetical protein
MLRTVLGAMCILLLIATAYLTLSLIVLNPPRVSLALWFALAGTVTIHSGLTLFAVGTGQPPAWLRLCVAAGACVLIGLAAWRVHATLTASHFEGYNLIWSALLAGQGGLTLASFSAEWLPFPRERPDRCN